jgi:hypothetical protein
MAVAIFVSAVFHVRFQYFHWRDWSLLHSECSILIYIVIQNCAVYFISYSFFLYCLEFSFIRRQERNRLLFGGTWFLITTKLQNSTSWTYEKHTERRCSITRQLTVSFYIYRFYTLWRNLQKSAIKEMWLSISSLCVELYGYVFIVSMPYHVITPQKFCVNGSWNNQHSFKTHVYLIHRPIWCTIWNHWNTIVKVRWGVSRSFVCRKVLWYWIWDHIYIWKVQRNKWVIIFWNFTLKSNVKKFNIVDLFNSSRLRSVMWQAMNWLGELNSEQTIWDFYFHCHTQKRLRFLPASNLVLTDGAISVSKCSWKIQLTTHPFPIDR